MSDSIRQNKTAIERNAYSLAFLFQATAACAVFLSMFLWMPALAIGAVILLTPAFVRTGYASELHRRKKIPFSKRKRVECFCASIGVNIMVAAAGGGAFILISILFGILGAAGTAVAGIPDMSLEAGILGTAGGMIWGIAAGMIAAMVTLTKLWEPPVG